MSTQTQTPTGELPAVAPVAPAEEPAAPAWRRRIPRGAEHLAVVPVLIFAAVMNTNRLSQNGFGNIYYSAAVKSMLRSAHNFFFVAYDPAGLVSVDKPPIGLWVQASSAKLFGFTPLALLLPEAIAGVIAVGVMYWIVARRFGVVGGVLSALALTAFPSFVAVSRDNNIDTVLILLMLLACGAALRATERGRLPWLIASGVLVGLAFNTKTLAAYLIVPGIAVAYLVCAPVSLRRRLVHLLAAGVVMALVSVAWIEAVDHTPPSHRPFVGGSTNNTEYNLTTQYNGVGRVGGQSGGPGRVPRIEQQLVSGARTARARRPAAAARPHGPVRRLVTFGGPTGPLRLLDSELGDQGGWLLPFAVVGMLALALLTIPRRRDPRLAVLLVLGSWFAIEALVLSFGKGIIHPYYISALGPGTAAMVGAGAVALAELARRGGWRRVLPAVALGAAALGEVVMLNREHYLPWAVPVLVGGALVSAVLLLFLRRGTTAAMAFGVGALLIAPAAVSATTWDFRVQGTFPAAGPTAGAGRGPFGIPASGVRFNQRLLSWAEAHRPGSRWVVLTDASNVAAPMILLGAHAGALGGYSGGDPVLDGVSLARLVARGEARYMLMGGVFWDRGGNRATRAIINACRPVPPEVWQTGNGAPVPPRVRLPRVVPPPTPVSFTLYDCAGREQQLIEYELHGRVTPAVTPAAAARRARRAARAHG